jgi:hypothetical protein
MLDTSQFNTDRTCPGRCSNAPINMFVPATIVELGPSSRATTSSSQPWPRPVRRRAVPRSAVYGVPSDFELNFGRYLPTLGRADDDDTDRQPDRSSPIDTGIKLA